MTVHQQSNLPDVSRERAGTLEGDERKNIYIAKSYRISIINWFHVSLHYLHYVVLAILVAVAAMAWQAASVRGIEMADFLQMAPSIKDHVVLFWHIYVPLGLVALFYLARGAKRPVYLVDFAVWQAPESWKVTHEDVMESIRLHAPYSDESLAFMRRILERTGTGNSTAWPPGCTRVLKGEKPDTSMQMARTECQTIIFDCVQQVLEQTGTHPKKIDFVIVNCSLFSPTPSIAAMIVGHFKMRKDIRSYNLSGMGCSAGLISVDLAQQLLDARPNSTALVVSTEIISQMMYKGAERSMLMQNLLFRSGGAAVLLSNRPTDAFRAKYKLLRTVRAQRADEDSYNCVYECEDSNGLHGVRLSKNLTKIAGKALTENLTLMGPHVLPLREQFKVLATLGLKRVVSWLRNSLLSTKYPSYQQFAAKLPEVSHYVPDFTSGVQHFCIHAGGRAVIDGVEQNLRLSPALTAPSRATLKNYGNTSSSSIWYELKYVEQEGEEWIPEDNAKPIKRGDRVIQIAFGSGFKCNSALWVRM